jgi:hypothetical protein
MAATLRERPAEEPLGQALIEAVLGQYRPPREGGLPPHWLRHLRALVTREPALHGEYLTAMAAAERDLGDAIAERLGSIEMLRAQVLAAMVAGAERVAVPTAYTIIAVVVRRRVELWAVLTAVGFALGCPLRCWPGGSSLPLKLYEAAVTFLLGMVLLGAPLVRRPLPLGRMLKVPHNDRTVDATLSVMVGSFVVLHLTLAL